MMTRRIVLHDGCEDPHIYSFYDGDIEVIVEIDSHDVGECDEECVLFRMGDCETSREDRFCDRCFKPLDYQTAVDLCMA